MKPFFGADGAEISKRFVFTGERLRYVVFPLGGIGAGGLSVSGSGRLTDWGVRNKPAIQRFNACSHFAVKAERDGKLLDARVLHGPFEGDAAGLLERYGHGANRHALVGLPHFSEAAFVGRFPVGEWRFSDPRFPGVPRMTAFSPFIPHRDRDSSMPVAMFEFELENPTDAAIDYTVSAVLANYGFGVGRHEFIERGARSALQLLCDSPKLHEAERGDLSLMTEGDGVERVDYFFRGQWFDGLARYWRDFTRPGPLANRRYGEPREDAKMFAEPEHGALARRVRIPPGGFASIKFVISWNYPVGHIYWRESPGDQPPPTWRNFYATQWRDSLASGAEAMDRWDELRRDTFAFRDSLFGSSSPEEIVDAVAGTLALLRTPTVLRLEGGELWGWEGQNIRTGSCEGSCTHVWNSQQALSSLFPALERGLRETEFRYNQLPNGGLTFRTPLPLGSGFDPIGPCADGHFGAVIKTYREWKHFGDDGWLAQLWPGVRKAIAYAWSPENPDRWDPDRAGVLQGRQHHTLDMELFGPNSWLSSIYLAALRAASIMADAMGEPDFARTCEEIAGRGRDWIDANLFNGRYYEQKLDLSDKSVLVAFDEGRPAGVLSDAFLSVYWSDEFGEINYQIGEGCQTDQLLGQWHADLVGLGDLLDPGHIDQALRSIFAENFRASLKDHVNPGRVFAYEDEAGVLLCSWPEGRRKPAIPAPYTDEIWTGVEYALASHLILRGMPDEGLRIVRAARARHDGSRRSPYNEIECGGYYVRSLSSYAALNAWIGLSFDQRRDEIGFRPTQAGTYFWSAGRGWGEIAYRSDAATLTVKGGELRISRLSLPLSPGEARVDGAPAERRGALIQLPRLRILAAGDRLTVQTKAFDT